MRKEDTTGVRAGII